MENPLEDLEHLRGLDHPRGKHRRRLQVGVWSLALEGLDDEMGTLADRRWGGFLGGESRPGPSLTLRVFEAGSGLAPRPWERGEPYSIEGEKVGGRLLVRAHHFAMCQEDRARPTWRLGIIRTPLEPPDRILENAVRYLSARLAVEEGGLAIHGAGVLQQGKAYVLAGPSRSGKTTAVGLSAPSTSLGDDFALLLPGEGGWRTAAVPFDNSEEAPADPPKGSFPVAGVWRLHQASRARVEALSHARATASMMGCAAFLWAMPDMAHQVLEHVKRFVAESRFLHLYFRKDPDFWKLLLG